MSGNARVFQNQIGDTATTDTVGVGTIRWEGNKCYKWVKYDDGAADLNVVSGDVVFYVKPATSVTGTDVTPDASDSDGVVAGVVQATITLTATFCWIQIKGIVTLNTALTAGADGNLLTGVGAGDKTMDVSALVSDQPAATAIDASAKIVMLDCPY